MTNVFYISSLVAIIATLMVITRVNPVHALLYMVVSLFSIALVFFSMGAPFVAALEVIVYAGAIMVLFVFVIMMLNLGAATTRQEKEWMRPRAWAGPALLTLVLFGEFFYFIKKQSQPALESVMIGPQEVGLTLFGPYLLGVELTALLLLAGMVGAYHLARRPEKEERF